MKITRFVNGNKIEKPLGSDIKVKNEAVQNAIEKANRRILKSSEQPDFGERGIYD